MKCYDFCEKAKAKCSQKECKYWIDYEEDLNCTIVATNRHGHMTLREVGKRLSLSFVRVKQIQEAALRKLRIRIRNIN